MSPAAGVEVRLAGKLGAFALDVGFGLPAVGVTALVGPSGSGKSTVLRALAGLERLQGTVTAGGETWQDARRFTPPHRRRVGYVFQHAALLPHLSVRGNLDYGRRRARTGPEHLDRVVALLGLAPLLERSPSRLSGGERQRVAIGRALVTDPRLLLLDEPLSGLDAEAKAELLPALKAVLGGLEAPVLYVSHDRAEVAQLAGRTLQLQAGRILAASEPGPEDRLAGLTQPEIARLALAALRNGLA